MSIIQIEPGRADQVFGFRLPVLRRSQSDVVRRVLELCLTVLGTIALAPVIALIAIAVKLEDNGPIFFSQNRIGLDGKIFRCWKFRSMVVDAEARLQALLAEDPVARAEWADDHKLKSDPRLTSLGVFLRKWSLDELPQLFNILAGDMSIVGPRPIVPAETSRYGWRLKHYCSVKPGLTGLWQVSGRNDTTYDRRVGLDCLYVRRRSLLLDLGIIASTLSAVLSRRGAY